MADSVSTEAWLDQRRWAALEEALKAQGGQFIKPLPRNGLCLIKVVGETALHRLGVSLQITAQPYGHIQKFLAITR